MPELMNCMTLQSGQSLYAFSQGYPLSVTRYSNLLTDDARNVTKQTLTPAMVSSKFFALANYKDSRVYVSGGVSNGEAQRTVLVYNFAKNDWTACPDMNLARRFHSSYFLKGKLYVFFGMESCR